MIVEEVIKNDVQQVVHDALRITQINLLNVKRVADQSSIAQAANRRIIDKAGLWKHWVHLFLPLFLPLC